MRFRTNSFVRAFALLLCLGLPRLAAAQEPFDTNIPPEAEYPFKRDMEKGKYDKADEKIRRRIDRDTNNLECHYAAYRLYSTAGCPFRNLDTAYRHLVHVRNLYAKADEKELERWARDSYSGARIDYDLYLLGKLALTDAHRLRTPDAYQHILNCYALIPYQLRDSATNSRDSLEFDIARRSASVATLQDFIDRRPRALVLPDAVLFRDSLAFAHADAQHTYTAYQHFRVAYPHSHLFDRATDSVYTLDYRDALHHNTEQYYRGYAERYPTSPYVERCLWLADSIEYHREADSTDWQSILHYLDSRNRPLWRDSAALLLTRYALQNHHIEAARHAALRIAPDAPFRDELGELLHHSFIHTSVLNFNRFYNSPLANLVSEEWRQKDSVALLLYQNRDHCDIDSCIRLIAPCHEAYRLLQQRIKNDLDHHRWKAALATASRYSDVFANDYNYLQLVSTLKGVEKGKLKVESGLSAQDYVQLSLPNFQFPICDTMLAADGRILLFSAYGKCPNHAVQDSYNLYVSFLDSTGAWGKPIELGITVNTPFAERFPHLHPDLHTLYFSSEGHGSIGGLDVFMTTRLDDSWTHWSQPVNIGKGINTTHDDRIK